MISKLGKNQRRLLQRMFLEHDGRWPASNWITESERDAMARLVNRGLVVITHDGYRIPDERNEMLRDLLGIEL